MNANAYARQVAKAVMERKPIEAESLRHTVSVRTPVSLLSRVDVLAKRGGMSRNQIITLLAQAGLQVTLDELPSEEREDLEHAADALLLVMLNVKNLEVVPGSPVEVLGEDD